MVPRPAAAQAAALPRPPARDYRDMRSFPFAPTDQTMNMRAWRLCHRTGSTSHGPRSLPSPGTPPTMAKRSKAIRDGVFDTAVALLLTHELDAALRHEWRVLLGFRSLPEEAGRATFILAHVPLIAGILYVRGNGNLFTPAFQGAVDAFCVIHVGLHLALTWHTKYEFEGAPSNGLIWGCGLVGAAHLAWLALE